MHIHSSTFIYFYFFILIFFSSFPFLHQSFSSSISPSPSTITTTTPITLPSILIRQPVVPPVEQPPTPTPAPISSPSPSPSSPIPVPPPTVPPSTTTTVVNQATGFRPSRDRCSPGLRRMLAVLLLELCFEFLFLFMRCFVDQTLVYPPQPGERAPDVTFRGYIFMRAVYAVPVLILNCAIYWIGGGPTGACLTSYSEIQIAFAHLIFYLLYCVFVVVIGIYRIDLYDDKETPLSYTYNTGSSPSNGGASPPSRTQSYFHSASRRRRSAQPASESYEQPKFRVNLGCCAINF